MKNSQPVLNSEMQPVSEWDQVVSAFKVFKDDYEIVGHTAPHVSPYAAPNGVDENGNRQYSVSQIPEGMTKEEFLRQLAEVQTLFVGCMDKDAIRPMYDKLQEQYEGGMMTISMAGGVVQHTSERAQALETILAYIAQHGTNIIQVIVSGHNHDCGLVKVATNGKPPSENLRVPPASEGESAVMKQLIKAGVDQCNVQQMFPNATVQEGLVSIDRKGGAKLDTNFSDITPLSINDFASELS